jgi:hypothetical protein
MKSLRLPLPILQGPRVFLAPRMKSVDFILPIQRGPRVFLAPPHEVIRSSSSHSATSSGFPCSPYEVLILPRPILRGPRVALAHRMNPQVFLFASCDVLGFPHTPYVVFGLPLPILRGPWAFHFPSCEVLRFSSPPMRSSDCHRFPLKSLNFHHHILRTAINQTEFCVWRHRKKQALTRKVTTVN